MSAARANSKHLNCKHLNGKHLGVITMSDVIAAMVPPATAATAPG